MTSTNTSIDNSRGRSCGGTKVVANGEGAPAPRPARRYIPYFPPRHLTRTENTSTRRRLKPPGGGEGCCDPARGAAPRGPQPAAPDGDGGTSNSGGAGSLPASADRTRAIGSSSAVADLPGATGSLPASVQRADLTMRRATPLDVEPLSFFFDTALRKDYFLRRGQLEEFLASDRHRVYVAEIDCVLVGAAITTRGNRLVNALVHPNFRGIGIGRALVEYSGAKEVRAKLDMSTGDPRAFYESLGFEKTHKRNAAGNIQLMRKSGRRPRRKPNRSLDDNKTIQKAR